jgi:integrase
MKVKSRTVVGENPAEERKAKRQIPTIQELSVRYMDYVKAYKRSWINDDRALRNHILPKFGKLRLDELQQDDVAVWLKAKLDEDRAMASVNFLHIILGCMYKLAKQWKIPGAEINPMTGIPHFQANNARERYLTAAEAERLRIAVEASENKQLKYIVSLLLLTGARKTELFQARWADIDVDRRAWRVPLAKSGKARQIPLSKAALDVIAQLPKWEGCPFLIPNPETMQPFRMIHRSWDAARRRAGLADVRMHDLRHSAASNMVNAGQSLYVVGKVLGHTQPTTTQRYAHLSQEALLAAADAGAGMMNIAWSEGRQV